MSKSAEAWDFIKINFKWLVAALLIFLLYTRGTFDRPPSQQPIIVSDTTTKQIPQPIVIMPPYTPQQGSVSYPIVLPSNAQGVIPASTVEELVKQVNQLNTQVTSLGKELYATRTYNDSIELKDTAGKKVGIVNLQQGVSENKLQYTKPSYQLNFPTTTITTTITQPAKPRTQVYFGGGFSTLINNPNVQDVHVGILLKNKKDNVLSLNGKYDFLQNGPGVTFSYYTKIKL